MRETTWFDGFISFLLSPFRPKTMTVYVKDPEGYYQPVVVANRISMSQLDEIYGKGNWAL